MSDREWYEASGTGQQFTNLESAQAYAEQYISNTGNEVTILRCTSTPVRRYWRETKTFTEEINPLA